MADRHFWRPFDSKIFHLGVNGEKHVATLLCATFLVFRLMCIYFIDFLHAFAYHSKPREGVYLHCGGGYSTWANNGKMRASVDADVRM